MKKIWDLYTMEYYSAYHKKNELMPFAAAWMDLEIVILCEVIQTDNALTMNVSGDMIPVVGGDPGCHCTWQDGQCSVSPVSCTKSLSAPSREGHDFLPC